LRLIRESREQRGQQVGWIDDIRYELVARAGTEDA
jgi:hypothetical protein